MVFALQALLTLVAAAVLLVDLAPNRLGLIGIGLGVLGTLLILGLRGGLTSSDLWSWILLALGILVSIAIGNAYRTMDWSEGASPVALAHGMLLGTAFWISMALLATGLV